MNIALWIASGLLAAAYLAAGLMKATQPLEKLKTAMPWTTEYSARTVRLVGVAEIAGAIGVVLPWATGIAPVLTPIAATGLVVIQALAIRHHVQRKENQVLPVNVVLLLLALFVAVGRFAGL
jgi:uncharacterized membrane protein